jgi:predicted DNA-binding transcriptional regulator YafY
MRADRLIKLMMLLNKHGKMRAQTLSERLEVSRRTIYRDLDALTTAGVPVYSEGGPGGGIWLDEHYRISLTGLSEAELSALFVSGSAGPLAELGLAQAAEDSLLKLFAAMPAFHRHQIERYQSRIYLDHTDWWSRGKAEAGDLELVQKAIFDERLITMRYERNDGSVVSRTVQPYGLVAKANAWYLVAAHDEGFRTYRISRIRSVELLTEGFVRQSSFDLKTHWETHSQSFIQTIETYTFTIRLRSSRLAFLRLYVSGQIELEPDSGDEDWLVAVISVGTVEAAIMIVLGLGNDCVIIAPDTLKEVAARHLETVRQALSQQVERGAPLA